MSLVRKTQLILLMLCVLIAVGSGVTVAQSIEEPDSWGEPVTVDDVSGEAPEADPPGDFKNASINYNEGPGELQFRINFTDSATKNPLSDNITQIYIDTGTSDGVDDTTYTDGGATEDFYDNLDDLDADERITVGDGTQVVEPWDEATSQFDGSSSDAAEVKLKEDYAVVQISEDDIKAPDEIDYKFVYINTRNGVESVDDYTWAPDPGNNAEESLRFSFTGTGESVPVGTINATVNISKDSVADDTVVEFSLSDGTTDPIEHDSSQNVTNVFSVDSNDFNGNDGETITATIDGENYTLDREKSVAVDEGEETNVTFEPHELINVSGEINNRPAEGTYSIEVQSDDGETIDQTGDIQLDASGAGEYNFTGINATEFTGGGEVVASLDADPNTIENESNTNRIFNTSRYNPEDVKVDFSVKSPDQTLDLTTNVSKLDEFKNETFTLNVSVSTGSSNRIDTFKHVIEFDSAQLNVVENEIFVDTSNGQNKTDTSSADGAFETIIVNSSGGPVVQKNAADVTVYNITFELVEGLDPDQGDGITSDNSVPVEVSTVIDTETEVGTTRLVNSTDQDGTTKEIQFTANPPGTVDVYDTETIIEENDPEQFAGDVNHLTTGGDMVDAPIKFDIPDGSVTSNEGKIKKIVLRNTKTDTVNDTIDCGGEASCGGELEDIPSNSTYLDNGSYMAGNRYNIRAVPDSAGSNLTVKTPRGSGGQEIYRRADVTLNEAENDTGNVTLGGDVVSILELRDEEATGGLPWDSIEAAQHDVNNDGVIDIIDVTIVADKYEP